MKVEHKVTTRSWICWLSSFCSTSLGRVMQNKKVYLRRPSRLLVFFPFAISSLGLLPFFLSFAAPWFHCLLLGHQMRRRNQKITHAKSKEIEWRKFRERNKNKITTYFVLFLHWLTTLDFLTYWLHLHPSILANKKE